MRAEVDTVRLRQYVVRVDGEDGGRLGSGFFVAPGWVLTAAHVVAGLDRVVLVPAAGGGSTDAQVIARSDEPDGATPASLWPFPDLALLKFAAKQDHPSALLEPVQPATDGECVAWGYARRDVGVDEYGSPASFSYVGMTEDGWLSLKADVVRHGLSGSPLVCPTRRAVVGVMSATWDETAPLGGLASPISALTGEMPGVPAQLVEVGSEVLRLNRAAVLADRGTWHAVLPVPGSDAVLRRSWGVYRKGRRADPADLLLADFRVVPYLFRDADLDVAEAWCLGPEAVAVGVVPGLGGAGKTRFGIEICQRMLDKHGWVVVGETGDLAKNMALIAGMPLPRLLLVDYAEAESSPVLADLLERLGRVTTDVAPARVLLLTRALTPDSPAGIMAAVRADASASVKFIVDGRQESPAASRVLHMAQRVELFDTAVDRFATAWEAVPPTGERPDLEGPDYGQPLGVLYLALDTVLSGPDPGTADAGLTLTPDDGFWGPDPAQRVLAHEEKYWLLHAPDQDRELLRQCVALSTLAGASDPSEADTLLRGLPPLAGEEAEAHRDALVQWLHSLYRGEDHLNPLRPDRLGESLVVRALIDGKDGTLIRSALLRGSHRQAARAVTVLTRCSDQDPRASAALAAVMAELHPHLTLRAESAAHGSPDRVGDYRLANTLVVFFTSGLGRALAKPWPDNTVYQRDVSVSLGRLGDLARAVGDGAGARTLYQQSLTISEELAKREPDNTVYQRDVSVSLDRLGDLARAVGDGAGARTLYQQSLTIREELAKREPDNTGYQRDVSVSLNKLGDLARAVGDGAGARTLYQQSLTIAEELAKREPDNTVYQRDVSVSLDRLGDLARAVGDGAGARTYFLRAVVKRGALQAQEPERLDLAEELCVALYLLAAADPGETGSSRSAVGKLLDRFDSAGVLSPNGRALRSWAENGHL
jgi:Trypsin-like peptidase domain/Tetratricopeptide repeat